MDPLDQNPEYNHIPATHAVVPVRWLDQLLEVYYTYKGHFRQTLREEIELQSPAAERVDPPAMEIKVSPVPPGFEPQGAAAVPAQEDTES